MSESSTIDCKFLFDNQLCRSIAEYEEVRIAREKECANAQQNMCCYRCAFRVSCEISCSYLNRRGEELTGQSIPSNEVNVLASVDESTRLRLRPKILEMITVKAGLNFPIVESDFPAKERQEINTVVKMLNDHETNLQRIREMENWLKLYKLKRASTRVLFLGRQLRDTEKEECLSQIHKLENENNGILLNIDQKTLELAAIAKKSVLVKHEINFQIFLDALKDRGIVLEKLECPHCGGLLQVSEVPKKEQMLQCRYCGMSILAMNLYEKFKEILKL